MAQSDVQKWLGSRVKITRFKTAGDNFGGVESTPEDIAFDIPARIYGVRGREVREVAGRQYLPDHRIAVAPDTDLDVGDRITCGTDAYLVISILERRGLGASVLLVADLAILDL